MILKLKSQNGSSTLLVSLLLVTLVVFALLSISSTASELRLSRKNAENNKTYYMLDSEGKRFLYDIKSKINEALILSRNDPQSFFEHFDNLLGDNIIRTINSDNNTRLMTIERNIILEENSKRRFLDIILTINQPDTESSVNDICSVEEWKMWQEPFELNNTIDLWEGIP